MRRPDPGRRIAVHLVLRNYDNAFAFLGIAVPLYVRL